MKDARIARDSRDLDVRDVFVWSLLLGSHSDEATRVPAVNPVAWALNPACGGGGGCRGVLPLIRRGVAIVNLVLISVSPGPVIGREDETGVNRGPATWALG